MPWTRNSSWYNQEAKLVNSSLQPLNSIAPSCPKLVGIQPTVPTHENSWEFKITPTPHQPGFKKPKNRKTRFEAALLEQLSKIKFRFIVGQHCFTHTSNRPKKINSNFIDKKRKKRNLLSLAFLPSHTNQLLIVQLSTYTKKVTGMLGIRLFFCCCFCFFYKVFFLL